VNRRLRLLLGVLAAALALVAASGAAAVTVRPAALGLPYVQISDSAAQAAQAAPISPDGRVYYTPVFIRQAYDIPSGPDAPTGLGQTILVVTAFGSPTLDDDVAQFNAENGLPKVRGGIKVITQKTPVSSEGGDPFQWQIETSLDVEWAHAIAPGAKIVVAVADTDDTGNIAQVVSEVLPRYPDAIVVQSFGVDEAGAASDPDAARTMNLAYLNQVLHGGTVLAAAGDFGASNLTPFVGQPVPMAAFPAASPLVLAIGGTMGDPHPDGLWQNGHYGGEQVWNEVIQNPTGLLVGATGGAPSTVYPAPPWQLGLTGVPTRAEPDVAFNAALDGGVIIVLGGKHGVIGGTSAATPQWAAIIGLANDLRGHGARTQLGLATPQLYALARNPQTYARDFHDITKGNNALFGDPAQLPGFLAKPGYDLPTGLGTPVVSQLLRDLASIDNPKLRADDLIGGGDDRHGHGRHRFVAGG
jgi:subtilase family serine protease